MKTVKSINGVTIRLPDERWIHIVEEHAEMTNHLNDVFATIEKPLAIFAGNADELLAAREIETGKYIIVVYREINKEDGFVITAFLTRRWSQIQRRKKLWSQ
jgi:hypothetical protein